MKAPSFETTRTLATVLAVAWAVDVVWLACRGNCTGSIAALGACIASLTTRGCYTMLIMFRPFLPWHPHNHPHA